MSPLKPRTILRVRLHPQPTHVALFRQWWQAVLDLDTFASTLALSYLRREPLICATQLIAQQASDDVFNRPDPNQLFLGHRILGRGQLPAKTTFRHVLADVAQQTVPFKLPHGLLDGLTLRWYEAIAEGDTLTYGDLPQVRCIHSVPELFLKGMQIQDDLSVTLFCHQNDALTIPAEVFCLPTAIRAALISSNTRVSESVIQCCGEAWWLWLVFTNLDAPLQTPTRSLIGLDPGVRRWLSGYADHAPVIFPELHCAAAPTLAARFEAYERQRETVEEVTETLLQYQLVGIEGTTRTAEMRTYYAHLETGFLCSILDQVASAGLQTAERRLLQIPPQFSSSVDAHNHWLSQDAYRPGRMIVEDGQSVDRDTLGARNLSLRLQEHHLACPRWWQILPLEFHYLLGLSATTLVPKPRRASSHAVLFKTS